MKKYMLYTISILFLLIIILLPKDIIPKKYEIDYELIKEENIKYIYYVKEENVYGYPVVIEESNKFKLIPIVFSYLTEKSNSVSKEYHTKLNLNSKLVSYEIINNDIYLELSNEFYNMKKDDAILALAQVLYSYKEMGFDEVYFKKDGKIESQMASVILSNGLKDMAVNLDMANTTNKIKTVKIIYYYKDKTKGFINHVINSNEDETTFKLQKIIKFINKEYKVEVKLLNVSKTDTDLTIYLNCNEKDLPIVKKLLIKNLGIKEENIVIN